MKPLFSIVVTILVISANALPENIQDVKEMPQTKEPIVEAEENQPQIRVERCTTCAGPKLNLKSHKDVLAAIQQFPGAEVHTQQSFEGCSSEKGCAGIKVKDGQILEKFGNLDAFRAAAAQDTGNEFTFHAAGTLGNNLLEGGLNGEGPFWWMNQNSPFKNTGAGGNFEKFSKSSSSSFSTTGNGGANFDIAANPFLNGDFSKLSGGFTSGGASLNAGASGAEAKPSSFQSSSFESSSFSTSNKDLDLSNNPFLGGKVAGSFGAGQFGQNSGSQFGQSSQFEASQAGQNSFNANKFGSGGYTGSSPSPFSATTGSNINLIQNSQKNDFEQQQQSQSIDEAFRNTGNVNAHENSGGDLQQTCAGQGYVCVHKAQCNNGVVNTNGRNLLQANTQKQYCNTRTEICCRIETSSLAGAGSLQGSLGVGSGIFASQSGQSSQSGFSQTGQNSQNGFSQSGQNSQNGFSQSGQNSQNGFSQNGQGSQSGTSLGSQGFNQNGASAFGSSFNKATTSSFGTQGTFGAAGNSNFGANSNAASNFGANTNSASNFGANSGSNTGFGSNSFGSESSSFEQRKNFGGFGSTVAPTTNRFNGNNFNNEVYKSTSQSNFIETDSFSAGSETAGVYRPGAIGSGLKPGIPYLPPVDSSTSSSNQISSTAFVTTQRPFTTPRPTRPPTKPAFVPSTSAPGYLPPQQGESSNNRETRLPSPKPTYSEGELILDETRQPTRKPTPFTPGPTPKNDQNTRNKYLQIVQTFVPRRDSNTQPPKNAFLHSPLDEIPASCAAALKCTPIEFCTAEGVISTTTVVLTRDQDAYRVPLTDCRDIESGRVGKCCRDPNYTDPWPTNQLGKWVPGVFGGNDGRYVPDSKSSSSNNNPRAPVTVKPPITGSVILNNFIQPKSTTPTYSPNSITPGFPSSTPSYSSTKGQYDVRGQGQYSTGGQGQYITGGQGQYSTGGQGQYSTGGQGQYSTGGQGQFTKGGQGQIGVAGQGQTTQGTQFGQGSQFTQTTSSFGQTTKGQTVNQGAGFGIKQGSGLGVIQGSGIGVTQGQGSYSQGGRGQYDSQGQAGQNQYTQTQGIRQGQGQIVSQGQGETVIRGSGQSVSQGVGQTVSQGIGQTVTQGRGEGVIRGSGQTVSGSQGFVGQGQTVSQGAGFGVSQGNGFGVSQGAGIGVSQGTGFGVSQGTGFGVSQGTGFNVIKGQGQSVTQDQGFGISQGQGQFVSQGQGQDVSQGQGQISVTGQGLAVSQGSGQKVSQGAGFGIRQGAGQTVTQGFGVRGQGQTVSQGQGQFVSQGQGQSVSQGQGFGVGQGQGEGVSQGIGFGINLGKGQAGIGFGVTQGAGQTVSNGQGFGISQSGGQSVSQDSGFGITQGGGQGVSQGFGFGLNQGLGFGVIRGQGQALIQGQGQKLTQGVGSGEINGQGFKVTQGNGFGLENDYSESAQRVFLQQYSAGGQCGLLNPQKPYGNRDDLEADFAEIPWQAMVLLQTNRSLLCGGVITRPDVVITSAACVDGLDAKNVLIKGGEWKLGIDDEPLPFQIVQVKTILRHPFYQRGSLKYDAAILVLAENLRFAKNIYPICLPGSKDTLDAFYNGAGECVVTGWGKVVLQAHLKGSIMHSVNVSLLNPGACEAKLSQDYPHLLEQFDQDSCACGQPTNPANNMCKVDIGSALACHTGDGHYVMRGIYSWDSGCQIGNQIAGFYKFDLEWYEWAIGLIESVRFAQFTTGTKITKNFSSRINSGIKTSQIKGQQVSGIKNNGAGDLNQFGLGQVGQLGQFSQFGSSKFTEGNSGVNFGSDIKGPLTNTFSATYTEKKVFQSEPKIVTYTTKPEIVTFTTKPEYFTYTTKPKLVTYTTKPEIVTYTTKPEIVTFTTKPEIVTYTTKPKIVRYTTKPQIIRYETSGSGTNPQYVAPGVSFNPSLSDHLHKHSSQCKCLEGK